MIMSHVIVKWPSNWGCWVSKSLRTWSELTCWILGWASSTIRHWRGERIKSPGDFVHMNPWTVKTSKEWTSGERGNGCVASLWARITTLVSHGQPADHLRITWGLSPGCPYSKLQSALMILMKAIPSGKYLSHRIFFAKAMAMTIDLVTFGRVFFRKREERWRWRRRLL